MTVDEWSHSFIGDICECVVCVVSCHGNLFLTCNWKHVIEYVKFPQIFAHNVQTCAKFSCKNFTDVCPVFWILCLYTWEGGVFSWTHCIKTIYKHWFDFSKYRRISLTAHSWDWQSTKHIQVIKTTNYQTKHAWTYEVSRRRKNSRRQDTASNGSSQSWQSLAESTNEMPASYIYTLVLTSSPIPPHRRTYFRFRQVRYRWLWALRKV